ncbi:MAG TPA: hypothetical protein VN796_00560 [Acidimicrobiales bacterium]|nr:hypothetical protein [Acidimicrobiales bacterium]
MTTARERRRKDRERRAAARRLPPVRVRGGGRLQRRGRPAPVRMVGVGQFAQGVARRTERRRRSHGLRRVGGVVIGASVAVVLVLWIIARVAGHL